MLLKRIAQILIFKQIHPFCLIPRWNDTIKQSVHWRHELVPNSMNNVTDMQTGWTFFSEELNSLKPITYSLSSFLLNLPCKRRLVTWENLVTAFKLVFFLAKALGQYVNTRLASNSQFSKSIHMSGWIGQGDSIVKLWQLSPHMKRSA